MTASQYVEHQRDLLDELGATQEWPTLLFSDNSAAVALSVDPRAHHKSVQLTRAMAYVRELTARRMILPMHVRTAEQPADFLTKRLDASAFNKCRWLSGIDPLPSNVLSL
jgi:hypothetical protein